MIELPEAVVLSNQCNYWLKGRKVDFVVVNSKPHKFAWYIDEGRHYQKLLEGKSFSYSTNIAGYLCLYFEDVQAIFHDGVNLRFIETEAVHHNHQLLIRFTDHSQLIATVAMYGGLYVTEKGVIPTPYMNMSIENMNCLNPDFTYSYFISKASDNMSIKAFLATQQRFPGIGNGVIQDVCFYAGLHPKTKIKDCSESELRHLYEKLVSTVREMIALGGRDNEKDLMDHPGGYKVLMSNAQLKNPCTKCSGSILKENYMGGSIYFCPRCQPMKKA